MKNQNFFKRLQFATEGIVFAFKSESSFRFQILLGLGVVLLLSFLKAAPIWWAIIFLTIGAVLATELINTAIEHLADLVHPDLHPQIKIVKDCLAGAVLVVSLIALGILVTFLLDINSSI
jgi:diacylglycerol kinase (ATP)